MFTEIDKPRARAKQIAFLLALAEVGTITAAAKAAGISRQAHYLWLNSDESGSYRQALDDAAGAFADTIRDEVRRRAVDGWNEPVVYQGQIQKDKKGEPVVVRRFSDRLLELFAKAKCDEFREKIEHSGTIQWADILDAAAPPAGESDSSRKPQSVKKNDSRKRRKHE